MLSQVVTVLGRDPVHRACMLNGNSFQQDAICTLNGWQYAVFYSYSHRHSSSAPPTDPLYVHLARRKLPDGPWEVLVFEDYPQTADDGHNTVQMGICPGDGTIHLSYDHHCDRLRYRHSIRGLATDPAKFKWAPDSFTSTLDHLPGLPSSHKHFGYVTYPRFGAMGDDMFCTLRDGKAGLGDDHLYVYRPGAGRFTYVGTNLKGVESNPYIHGMDYRGGRLHVTWVYRGFVHYDGWDDPLDTKHKEHAGPNGAENNHNICYAYSDDAGSTWMNSENTTIGGTVQNDSPGIVVFEIPKGHGLANQEAQAVDQDGGVHVLNRDTMDGQLLWKHYYRSPNGQWTRRAVRPAYSGRRGRLAVAKGGDLYLVLPDPSEQSYHVLKASRQSNYSTYEEIWTGHGLHGEPLVDKDRLGQEDVLSIFAVADAECGRGERNVVVLDLSLE